MSKLMYQVRVGATTIGEYDSADRETVMIALRRCGMSPEAQPIPVRVFVAVAQYEDTALSSVSTESADHAMTEVRRLAGGFPHPFTFTWQEWIADEN